MLGGGRQRGRARSAPRSPRASSSRTARSVLARAARPDRDPVLPLRAAAAAAQAGLPLVPARRTARWPAAAAAAARALARRGPRAARHPARRRASRPSPVWEALEAEGLITRLLPDWERVRCRPQRNAVHTWTVDRHLVETAVRASALTRRVGRPDLLLVAALLHDIGKGWPGDHSVAGEIIARDVAARIGFDRADVAVLATARTPPPAARRDGHPARPGRPGHRRARSPRPSASPGTLELLHALTEADALATGPAAWSSWRGSLVADLVKRVAARARRATRPHEPRARRAHAPSRNGSPSRRCAPAGRCSPCTPRPRPPPRSRTPRRPEPRRRRAADRRARPAGRAARGGRRPRPAPADRPRGRPARRRPARRRSAGSGAYCC